MKNRIYFSVSVTIRFLLALCVLSLIGCAGPSGNENNYVRDFLSALGKNHLLVGASMSDATADAAPFDVRYQYVSGGIFDSFGQCPNCGVAHHCGPGGTCCPNSYQCHWWGCWQWDQDPPGQYVLNFIANAKADGQIPFITYYQILESCKVGEGAPEVNAVNNTELMSRYLADWRFLLQKIGNDTVLVQIEPRFWGYAQQTGADPAVIPAAVASADAVDGTGHPDTLAGLGQCMLAMARKYAPNARIGLHASGWATSVDCLQNTNPSADIVGRAALTGDFIMACGDFDFIAVDVSDRDAGYDESIGRNTWWDASNASLPHFRQFETWAKALSEAIQKPLIVWEIPVGNMNLGNTADHWKDNRLDYFFAHMGELAASHIAAVLFGAGSSGQTTPETDGGNLIQKTQAYIAAGGQTP